MNLLKKAGLVLLATILIPLLVSLIETLFFFPFNYWDTGLYYLLKDTEIGGFIINSIKWGVIGYLLSGFIQAYLKDNADEVYSKTEAYAWVLFSIFINFVIIYYFIDWFNESYDFNLEVFSPTVLFFQFVNGGVAAYSIENEIYT